MDSVQHSWYDKNAHVFRTDGRIVRAALKQLVFSGDAIYIRVQFMENGIVRCKDVSLLMIASLQVLWVNVDVVSDVELPEDIEDVTDFIPPVECDRLPPFRVFTEKTRAMQSLIIYVNLFLDILPTPIARRLPPKRRRSTRRHTSKDTFVRYGYP